MTEFRPSPFQILPTVIKNLVIINVLFFLAQVTIGSGNVFNMTDLMALHDVQSPLFKPWQIITHMFMHSPSNLMHIFFNMLMLWMFGSVLENLWGPKRFLIFYLLCGIGAALLHLTFLWYDHHQMMNAFLVVKQQPNPVNIAAYFRSAGLAGDPEVRNMINVIEQNPGNPELLRQMVNTISELTNRIISTPMLGASGAVFGVMAAFVYLFPNSLIYLYFFIPVKAKWIGVLYFGYEIYNAILNNPGDDIARWAHIGGGLVGFLLVITWNRKNRQRFH